jgi:hypothetical protein
LHEHQGDHELQAADPPDFGAQQVLEAQLEADREQQQQDAEVCDVIEQRRPLDPESIEQEAGRQESDQRRQPELPGQQAQNKRGQLSRWPALGRVRSPSGASSAAEIPACRS